MFLITLLGGLALLLYGIQLVGEGLQRLAGGRLRYLLTKLTRTRLAQAAVGALVTAVIQSSSATTLMLIGFVSAGLLSFSRAMGVILGADIGTTLTVQLLAFRIQEAAVALVAAGFAITFFAKRQASRSLGQAILGFGFVFLGLKLMTDGMGLIRDHPLLRQVVLTVVESPIFGIIVGAIVSALVASSAATIGVLLTLSHQGLLPLAGAIPIVLGANIGTCTTALTASMKTSTDGRRVAVAHIAFKLLGVLLVFPFLGPFTRLVEATASDPARQIANGHTLFNIGISAVFLFFQPLAARLITLAVPEREEADTPFRARYLDERFLGQPALAIGQATREALRMADVVQGMFRDTLTVFRTHSPDLVNSVEKRDDQVDYLDREIKLFLTRLSHETMSPDLSRKQIALLSFIQNMENIGDIIDKNLMELARKKYAGGQHFSEAGETELAEFHSLIAKNLERTVAAFATSDHSLAQEVLDQRPLMRQRERELRESHLSRLREGLAESLETSEIHLDVLTNLKRVNSHITSIAFPILEE
ncbi:MAG TPA: Na/Pi cotransporter family protein [Methylomirabilota bacterium]|nr:Na/Pi cotransporter family protein [Methylomirabilota bacterium]